MGESDNKELSKSLRFEERFLSLGLFDEILFETCEFECLTKLILGLIGVTLRLGPPTRANRRPAFKEPISQAKILRRNLRRLTSTKFYS